METSFGVATGLGPEYASLGVDLNMVRAVTHGVEIPGFGRYGPHPIAAQLKENSEFKESFITWFDNELTHEFLPDTTIDILEEMKDALEPYMQEHLRRWPYITGGIDGWNSQLDMIRDFLNRRPSYLRQHLQGFTSEGSEEIYLAQNTPNPFSYSTTFTYKLPSSEEVVLTVFDASGQVITSLINEFQQSGTHSITWNITGLHPGVYFYSLRAGKKQKTKAMLIME